MRAILTGGSAATFYSDSYQSLDLDFVITFGGARAEFIGALSEIGFLQRSQHFEHLSSRFTLDFPKGPLMIGNDAIREWETNRRNGETLHVLSRTDSTCDRLAAFIHWNDRGSLQTACDVAASGPIDIDRVRAWSIREGGPEKFAEFERVRSLPKRAARAPRGQA